MASTGTLGSPPSPSTQLSPGAGSSCWRPEEEAHSVGRVETPRGIRISVWEQKLIHGIVGSLPSPCESALGTRARKPEALSGFLWACQARPHGTLPSSGNRRLPLPPQEDGPGQDSGDQRWASPLFPQGSKHTLLSATTPTGRGSQPHPGPAPEVTARAKQTPRQRPPLPKAYCVPPSTPQPCQVAVTGPAWPVTG